MARPWRFDARVGAMMGAVLCSAAMSVGCSGAPSSSQSAKAKLGLRNDTGGGGLTTQQAGGLRFQDITLSFTQYFGMKLASVYLAEDVDPTTQDNVGQVADLWVSPRCTSADDCDFFNFARATGAVNADLNSQSLEVQLGTYRYARLEFCYHGERPTQPNVSWQGADLSSPHGFIGGGCGVTSKEFNPPLVLVPGDDVSVELGYDLADSTSVGPAENPGQNALTAPDGHGVGFDDCAVNDAMTQKDCFRIPGFVPTAVKNGGGPAAAVVVGPADGGGAPEGGD
jgi:hypothetical protein